MEKPKTLFHGSRFKIENFIEPKKAKDPSEKDNCQKAVYATDRFECAVSMSLSGESPAFMNYSEKKPKIVFMHKAPDPEKTVYVYEIPSDNFTETSENHQWISNKKIPILKTHKFKAKDIGNYWRFATEKEFDLKRKKFGYPENYREFFSKRPHLTNQRFYFLQVVTSKGQNLKTMIFWKIYGKNLH